MKDMKFPALLDIYGSVLSERKFELLDYYYNNDYSLSEISELTGISRQGVRDSIKKSEDEIFELENKLKIFERNDNILSLLSSLESKINTNKTDLSEIKDTIEKIKSLLSQ